MSILNIFTHIISYDDAIGMTDNPRQRVFDWARKYYGIQVEKPASEQSVVAPNSSLVLFDGSRSIGFAGDTVLSLRHLENGIYRLTISGGSGAFRTKRNATNIGKVTVEINNSAVAIFTFTGANLDDIQIGDIMRINGASLYDDAPYAFNALNSGEWVIIGKTNNVLQAVRPVGQAFSGIAESVLDASNDVRWYSADNVQVNDIIDITGTFSMVSWRAYNIVNVSDSTLDFISTVSLPIESLVPYINNTIQIYHNAKRFIYIESDQDAIVQFNGDEGVSNRISPLVAGNDLLPGFLHKFGLVYSCKIINRSVNPMQIKYFWGE